MGESEQPTAAKADTPAGGPARTRRFARAAGPLPFDEAGFRALAAALPQMLWVADTEGFVHYASAKWVDFTGCDEADLLGFGLQAFVHPEDADRLEGRFDTEGDFRLRMRRSDGEYRWLEVRFSHVLDDAGAIAWVVGGTVDITDEREAGTLARERGEQLRVALAITGLARYSYYPDAQRLIGDDRLAEILGMSPDRLMSERGLEGFLDGIHPEDRNAVADGIARALDGGDDYAVTYRIRRPQAGGGVEERWVVARGRAELDGAGPARLVGVVEDVTARRLEEEARIQSQKREAIGTLASGVAHDFNNVLSAILSNASVASAEYQAGASPAESLSEITRGARRAADMVRHLLAVSREEDPAPVAVDLGAVIDEACALVAPTLAPSVDFSWRVDRPLPVVVGDATQLHQVTMNLVANAGHAVGERGRIDVYVRPVTIDAARSAAAPALPAGRYLALCVTDDGVGMSDALVARAFDPYFTTRSAGEGTGLGLTASRQIARNHGGDIAIVSEPGRGTTVSIFLPITQGAPVADPPDEAAATGAGSAARVLFVDDEPALKRLAERALPLAGYATTAFDDPEEALAAFTEAPTDYDVVVTDLSMPGLNGLELIAQVRALRPQVGVVLSSGYLTHAHRELADALSVDAFVPKPCSIDELAVAIERALVTHPA